MARTYRRKNYIPDWIDSNDFEKIARYHSDKSDKFITNCPSRFRRGLNKELRCKNKEILKKCDKDNFDGIAFIPNKHNAIWLWW